MSARASTPSRAEVALLVGVSEGTLESVSGPLQARGLVVRRAGSVPEAAELVESLLVGVVLAAGAPDEELATLCESCGEVPLVVVLDTANEAAVASALRAGAVAALAPSPTPAEIALALDRALSSKGAVSSSEEAAPRPSRRGDLLGQSEPMRRVSELISRTAPVSATALVRGETGTGKELVARALHHQSPRRDGPFVKVHCAALPDALLESELFGYEKGAFTGATSRKPGRVELAEAGTLFLDEIGDITAATQVKLLRLLQDREYERLGGVQTLKADVRFVAATHRDLEGMVKKGDFREDLFYRLNVVTLWLPPLRARRDDVPLLAERFCRECSEAYAKPGVSLDTSALQALRAERWPGNVRQLQNFVERLVVLSTGRAITADDVRSEMSEQVQFKTQLTSPVSARAASAANPVSAIDVAPPSRALPLEEAVRNAERRALERALHHSGGNRTAAARVLGVSRATLYTKMEEHGIS